MKLRPIRLIDACQSHKFFVQVYPVHGNIRRAEAFTGLANILASYAVQRDTVDRFPIHHLHAARPFFIEPQFPENSRAIGC